MMVVVLFQLIFLNDIKVYMIVEIFRQTGLFKNCTKYNMDWPLIRILSLSTERDKKDKFGLSPIEPSSFSSIAPRSLLPGKIPPS